MKGSTRKLMAGMRSKHPSAMREKKRRKSLAGWMQMQRKKKGGKSLRDWYKT